MFENLSDRLSHTFKSIRGHAKLSEENIPAGFAGSANCITGGRCCAASR